MEIDVLYKKIFDCETLQQAFNIMRENEELSMREFKNCLNYIYELFYQEKLK